MILGTYHMQRYSHHTLLCTYEYYHICIMYSVLMKPIYSLHEAIVLPFISYSVCFNSINFTCRRCIYKIIYVPGFLVTKQPTLL